MWKKIRFWTHLVRAFSGRHKTILAFSFLIGAFFFFLLPKFLDFLPKSQKTKTIGLVGRYRLESLPEEIQNEISQGLTQINEDGTVAPALAKEWIVEDNGKTYIFKLAEDHFWHDKTAVMAKDINYNFKDVTLEIQDSTTIKFQLQEPFAPFPVVVSRPLFKRGLVGTGPYKVTKVARSGEFVETIFLESQNKKNPNLKYRFYPTEASAKTALKLGEVKKLENIVNSSGFEDWQNIEVNPQIKLDRYLALFFDTSKSYLGEKNFRQALAYALPKEKEKQRVLGPISSTSWAYNSDLKPYEYDLENAQKLLEKVVEKEKKITLRLATNPSLLIEAEKIRKAWEPLGVKTEIEAMTSPTMDFEILLAIQEIPADPDQYSLWHSTQQVANITRFNNKRIDALLEEGRKTLDVEKRKKIYFDFQRYLAEEIPAIFLYHHVVYTISRK